MQAVCLLGGSSLVRICVQRSTVHVEARAWLGCASGLSWAGGGIALRWACPGLSWCTDIALLPVGPAQGAQQSRRAPARGCNLQLLCDFYQTRAAGELALLFRSVW